METEKDQSRKKIAHKPRSESYWPQPSYPSSSLPFRSWPKCHVSPFVGSPIPSYHSTFLTPYVTHTICNFKWACLFIVSFPSPVSKLSKDRNSVCLKWHQALTPGSHPGRRWWKHSKTYTKAESTPISFLGWAPFLFSSESPRHMHPSTWDIMSLLMMENYLSSIFLPIGCLGSVLSTIHVLAYLLPLHVRAHTHTGQPYTMGAIIKWGHREVKQLASGHTAAE